MFEYCLRASYNQFDMFQKLTWELERMKIGIIDADLIGREKHRFPNLACEKISGYWKSQGAEVQLLLDYLFPDDFDRIYISKVFTDTEVPPLPDDERIHIGGTGFFFDKARQVFCELPQFEILLENNYLLKILLCHLLQTLHQVLFDFPILSC